MSGIVIQRIELYPEQDDFVACSDHFVAFIAGIAAGKTFAGAVRGLLHSKPGTLGLVVAPTYPMLRDAVLRTYMSIAGDACTLHKGEMLVYVKGGGEILFRSADEPDRLRGPNLHWAHIDEASLCPPQTWDVIIGRLRADGKAGACWVTSTPKGRNWLYDRISQMTVFRTATESNPYLAPEFVQSLKAVYTGKFAQQELYGDFVTFEGLVYDTFSRDVHICERSGVWKETIAGVDFGYTNPTAIIVVARDGDGGVHVLDEFYKRQMITDELINVMNGLQKTYSITRFVCDRSAPGTIEALRRAGLPAQPAPVAQVIDGIRVVQSLLSARRLTVSPRCVNTVAEFESYAWRDQKARDEPEKQNDHAMDALRYALSVNRSAVMFLE